MAPAAAPTPPPRPPTSAPSKPSRRGFLTLLTVVGAVLSLAPFVPWGTYLSASLKAPPATKGAQKITVDNNPTVNGKAAGKPVQVSDLTTFPPNDHWVITYPSSGDSTLDAQNPDTFVKWELIRLPSELGGDSKKASDFVAFSKVCVHLWCSPNYNPQQCEDSKENGYSSSPTCVKHEAYECPCHGSAYRLPDGLAVAGPASVQPPPTNAIPVLTLSVDPSGFLQVEPPVFDVTHNGVLGYGRAVAAKA